MAGVKKFGLAAIGKVTQDLPTAEASITALGNRVSELEGVNAQTRITELEEAVATLQAQVATLLTHTHNYEDASPTTAETKTTSEPT